MNLSPYCTSVFQSEWWLQIASNEKGYAESRVASGGSVLGMMPHVVRVNRSGLRWASNPAWGHLGGPIVSPHLDGAAKARVLREIIGRLPGHTSHHYVCTSGTPDANLVKSAFEAAGFRHTRHPTFLLSPDDHGILRRLNAKHRTQLNKALKELEVVEIGAAGAPTPDEFIWFYRKNLLAAGRRSAFPLEIAHHLITEGQLGRPPTVRVLGVRQRIPGAPLDAAVACVWDSARYYFWLSTYRRHSVDDPSMKPNGEAIKVLALIASEHARALGLTFDVDGAADLGSQMLFRNLGFRPTDIEWRDTYVRLSLPAKLCRAYPTFEKATALMHIAFTDPKLIVNKLWSSRRVMA